MSSQVFKIILSVLVIGGAGLYLLADTLFSAETLTYFHNADEVLADRQLFVGQRIRMGGQVKTGSIYKKRDGLDYQFQVWPQKNMLKHPELAQKTVTVRYSGVVPDTFKDDADIIVAGSLGPDGIFTAHELIAKCPSKYEAMSDHQKNLAPESI